MSGGNLKSAPLALTTGLVAKLVGDRPAYGRGIVRIPLESSSASCRTCGQQRETLCAYRSCPVELPRDEHSGPASARAPKGKLALPVTPIDDSVRDGRRYVVTNGEYFALASFIGGQWLFDSGAPLDFVPVGYYAPGARA